MAFASWFHWLKSRHGHFQRRRTVTFRRSFVLGLDLLEDRTVPTTFTVTSLANSGAGTLRTGILSGDNTIQFQNGLHGTITLASPLSITQNLTINGPGAGTLTVSGGGATQVFIVSGSATHLTINGLTIANGFVSTSLGNALGGGLLNNGASVTLSNDVFTGNKAVASDPIQEGPDSGAGGGAVASIGGTLTTNQTNFYGNTASDSGSNDGNGGAVYGDMNAVLHINQATFSGNLATGGITSGGAIANWGGSQLTVNNSSFTGNESFAIPPGDLGTLDASGGAINSQTSSFFPAAVGNLTTTNLANCSFTSNSSMAAKETADQDGGFASGGAVDIEDGAVATISNCTFNSNHVRGGDGGDGTAGMDGGDGGTAYAGAIYNAASTLTVSNSLFTGKVIHAGNGGTGGAGGDGGDGGSFATGGAIDATTATTDVLVLPISTISNCTFIGNQAVGGNGGTGGSGGYGGFGMRGDGGAVINLFGTMTVSNCTMVGNLSQGGAGGAPGSGGVGGDGGLGRGGAFSNERGGTATLVNVSILLNQALGGPGAVGGNGGNAIGGGVYNGRVAGAGATPNQFATFELNNCAVSADLALAGAAGVGGNGGDAQGGGIFNGNTAADGSQITTDPYPVLDLDNTNVFANLTVGGAAGAGVGGGLYNQSGAIADAANTDIIWNFATTSNNDIFGIVTPT